MGVGERARRPVLAALLAAVLAAAVAGCGSTAPAPYDVVNTYLSQIAEGTYSGACTQLEPGTREALIRRLGGKITCAEVFERCLPSYALNLSLDQTQLFYATILVRIHRRRATVIVQGTAVTRALKRLTLREHRQTWRLTSWGASLQQCPRRLRRRKHHHHHQHRSG